MGTNTLFTSPTGGASTPSELKLKLIDKAEQLLKLAKVEYKIVGEGIERGEWAPPAPRSASGRMVGYKQVHKGITSYTFEFVKDMQQAGDVRVVPRGKYPTQAVQKAVSGYLNRTWGVGSVTTHIRKDGDVEVMLVHDRVAGPAEPAKPDPLEGLDLSGMSEADIEQARNLLG
jgi:hypothetical protein